MAVINAFAEDAVDRAEPPTVAAAYAQCRDAALAESAIGAVGLEIESHLVDHVPRPRSLKRVEAIAAVVRKVAPGTAVTVEPGGQIELSGPPEAGVPPAVARLRREGTSAAAGHTASLFDDRSREVLPDAINAHQASFGTHRFRRVYARRGSAGR
jgi:hypothetical protein